MTSADRGISSTAVICASAAGNFIPPLLIFSRKKFKRELEDGAPPGTIFKCSETGWMKLDIFQCWFDHFLAHSKPSHDEPLLLILDGHLSHTKNLNVILKARENNVTILCLPPHTSHKTQPLDVGVMFPLSKYLDQALEKWLTNHPGRVITDYQVSSIFCEAYLKACTLNNAIKGFRKTGIYPFNPDVFTDLDFDGAAPTNNISQDDDLLIPTITTASNHAANPVPGPSNSSENNNFFCNPIQVSTPRASDMLQSKLTLDGDNSANLLHKSAFVENEISVPTSSTSSNPGEQMACNINSSFNYSPEVIKPLPKITRQRAEKRRKRGTTVILTSTPYKNALEEEVMNKQKKEEKKLIRLQKKKEKLQPKRNKNFTPNPKLKRKIRPTARTKSNLNDSSESEDDGNDADCLVCGEKYSDSASGEGWIMCYKCHKWAHDACAGVEEEDDCFKCDLCERSARKRLFL